MWDFGSQKCGTPHSWIQGLGGMSPANLWNLATLPVLAWPLEFATILTGSQGV